MDPFSQELRLRRAGVERDDIYRDIPVRHRPAGPQGEDQILLTKIQKR